MNNGFGGGDGSYEYGPNGLDTYNQSKDKIISTEGCFSCKGKIGRDLCRFVLKKTNSSYSLFVFTK